MHTFSGSQEERVGMLRMALSEKGVNPGSHYAVSPSNGVPAERDTVQRSTGVRSLEIRRMRCRERRRWRRSFVNNYAIASQLPQNIGNVTHIDTVTKCTSTGT